MRRRGFIAALGGAAAWPLAAHTQQPERVRRVGVLISPPESSPLAQAYVTAFVQALRRFGWVEGKNIQIDYRFAAGDPTLFKTYAAELVDLSPDAILTGGSPAVAAVAAPDAHDTNRLHRRRRSRRPGVCPESCTARGQHHGVRRQ